MFAWRCRLFRQLFPCQPGYTFLNRMLLAVVFLAVVVQVLETEPLLLTVYPQWFHGANLTIGFLFCLDYLLRLWAMGGEEKPGSAGRRWRYFVSLGGLLELAAILPFLMSSLPGGEESNDLFFLRLIVVIKMVRVAGVGHFAEALRHFADAVGQRRYELTATLFFSMFFMLLLATAMYLAEGKVQPQAFGSIPRALWWSVITLTSVGYGDVVPVTLLGKVLGGLSALVGIALVAMPMGLLASAFSEVFQKKREEEK